MEAREYSITLPYPPSVNHYWVRTRRGVTLSKAGRDYKTAVCLAVIQECSKETLLKPLAMQLEIYPPDNLRRDIDNTAKAVLDSLQAASVYKDDFQISDLHLIRRKVSKPGRVEVTIRELA